MLMHFRLNCFINVMLIAQITLGELKQKRISENIDAFFESSIDDIQDNFYDIPYVPWGDQNQATRSNEGVIYETSIEADYPNMNEKDILLFGKEKLQATTPALTDKINEKMNNLDKDLVELHHLLKVKSSIRAKLEKKRNLHGNYDNKYMYGHRTKRKNHQKLKNIFQSSKSTSNKNVKSSDKIKDNSTSTSTVKPSTCTTEANVPVDTNNPSRSATSLSSAGANSNSAAVAAAPVSSPATTISTTTETTTQPSTTPDPPPDPLPQVSPTSSLVEPSELSIGSIVNQKSQTSDDVDCETRVPVVSTDSKASDEKFNNKKLDKKPLHKTKSAFLHHPSAKNLETKQTQNQPKIPMRQEQQQPDENAMEDFKIGQLPATEKKLLELRQRQQDAILLKQQKELDLLKQKQLTQEANNIQFKKNLQQLGSSSRPSPTLSILRNMGNFHKAYMPKSPIERIDADSLNWNKKFPFYKSKKKKIKLNRQVNKRTTNDQPQETPSLGFTYHSTCSTDAKTNFRTMHLNSAPNALTTSPPTTQKMRPQQLQNRKLKTFSSKHSKSPVTKLTQKLHNGTNAIMQQQTMHPTTTLISSLLEEYNDLGKEQIKLHNELNNIEEYQKKLDKFPYPTLSPEEKTSTTEKLNIFFDDSPKFQSSFVNTNPAPIAASFITDNTEDVTDEFFDYTDTNIFKAFSNLAQNIKRSTRSSRTKRDYNLNEDEEEPPVELKRKQHHCRYDLKFVNPTQFVHKFRSTTNCLNCKVPKLTSTNSETTENFFRENINSKVNKIRFRYDITPTLIEERFIEPKIIKSREEVQHIRYHFNDETDVPEKVKISEGTTIHQTLIEESLADLNGDNDPCTNSDLMKQEIYEQEDSSPAIESSNKEINHKLAKSKNAALTGKKNFDKTSNQKKYYDKNSYELRKNLLKETNGDFYNKQSPKSKASSNKLTNKKVDDKDEEDDNFHKTNEANQVSETDNKIDNSDNEESNEHDNEETDDNEINRSDLKSKINDEETDVEENDEDNRHEMDDSNSHEMDDSDSNEYNKDDSDSETSFTELNDHYDEPSEYNEPIVTFPYDYHVKNTQDKNDEMSLAEHNHNAIQGLEDLELIQHHRHNTKASHNMKKNKHHKHIVGMKKNPKYIEYTTESNEDDEEHNSQFEENNKNEELSDTQNEENNENIDSDEVIVEDSNKLKFKDQDEEENNEDESLKSHKLVKSEDVKSQSKGKAPPPKGKQNKPSKGKENVSKKPVAPTIKGNKKPIHQTPNKYDTEMERENFDEVEVHDIRDAVFPTHEHFKDSAKQLHTKEKVDYTFQRFTNDENQKSHQAIVEDVQNIIHEDSEKQNKNHGQKHEDIHQLENEAENNEEHTKNRDGDNELNNETPCDNKKIQNSNEVPDEEDAIDKEVHESPPSKMLKSVSEQHNAKPEHKLGHTDQKFVKPHKHPQYLDESPSKNLISKNDVKDGGFTDPGQKKNAKSSTRSGNHNTTVRLEDIENEKTTTTHKHTRLVHIPFNINKTTVTVPDEDETTETSLEGAPPSDEDTTEGSTSNETETETSKTESNVDDLYCEIPVKQNGIKLSTNCTASDYKNKNHCICSVHQMLKDLADDMKDINASTKYVYDCTKFIRIEPGIVIGNKSQSVNLRKKREFNMLDGFVLKEGCRVGRDINSLLLLDLKLKKDDIIYATVGSKIEIPCETNREAQYNEFDSFDWNINGSPETAGIKENNGSKLLLNRVIPQDNNNYSCIHIFKNTTFEKRKTYIHHLSVVSLPMYSLLVTVVLNSSGECNPDDMEALNQNYPVILNNLLCSDNDAVCSVSIEKPKCVRSGKENTISIHTTLTTSPLFTMMPKLNQKQCDLTCQSRVYSSIIGIIQKNFASVTNLPVFFRLSYRHVSLMPIHYERGDKTNTFSNSILTICPAGFGIYDNPKLCYACLAYTFNPGNEMKCLPCPKGSYQPAMGSASCLPCTSPLDDSSCFLPGSMADYSRKFSIIPIVSAALIILLICLCCCQSKRRKKRDINSKAESAITREPSVHETTRPSLRSRGGSVNKSFDRTRYKKIPPKPPPIDF